MLNFHSGIHVGYRITGALTNKTSWFFFCFCKCKRQWKVGQLRENRKENWGEEILLSIKAKCKPKHCWIQSLFSCSTQKASGILTVVMSLTVLCVYFIIQDTKIDPISYYSLSVCMLEFMVKSPTLSMYLMTWDSVDSDRYITTFWFQKYFLYLLFTYRKLLCNMLA